jgi:cell division protein FtsB
MNWRQHEAEIKADAPHMAKRVHEESFQFWYRGIVMLLLSALVTMIGTVIVFQWQNAVDMAAVKVQLAGINTTIAGVPEMKQDLAVLKESNDDLKRRMEVYEGVRAVK